LWKCGGNSLSIPQKKTGVSVTETRASFGWRVLRLIYCERKILLAGWWLMLNWCERKALATSQPNKAEGSMVFLQHNRV
jgi:hypothetical protein